MQLAQEGFPVRQFNKLHQPVRGGGGGGGGRGRIRGYNICAISILTRVTRDWCMHQHPDPMCPQCFILTRVTRDWCIYASVTDPSGLHSALFRARSVLPIHLSANLVSPARPNELRSRKTFGVCRTRMPPCVCIDGPFRPHFARARAKGKRSFRTDRQRLASFRAFGRSISNLQLICPIYWLVRSTRPSSVHA